MESTKAPVDSAVGFMLVVTLTVNGDEKVFSELCKRWEELAAFVHTQEPNTLEYSLWHNDKVPQQVYIIEKYTDKEEAYLKVHRSSAPFLAFKDWMASLPTGTVTIAGDSFLPHSTK